MEAVIHMPNPDYKVLSLTLVKAGAIRYVIELRTDKLEDHYVAAYGVHGGQQFEMGVPKKIMTVGELLDAHAEIVIGMINEAAPIKRNEYTLKHSDIFLRMLEKVHSETVCFEEPAEIAGEEQ